MDHLDNHVCGNLPVINVALWATYCVHHMTWSAWCQVVDQDGEEPVVQARLSRSYGPFDDEEVILADMCALFRSAARTASRLP